MNNGLCNGIYEPSVLSGNPCLRSVEIGNECFSYTSSLLIESMPFLESIIVGNNTFTNHKGNCNSASNVKTRSLRINHCPHLKKFIVGKYSFSDYAGGLNLTGVMNSITLLSQIFLVCKLSPLVIMMVVHAISSTHRLF